MTTFLRSTSTTSTGGGRNNNNNSPSPTTNGMEIPKEILQKAAESALISSFVDLHLQPQSNNGITTHSIKRKPTHHTGQTRKVVIEIDLDKEGASTPSHCATSFFVKSIPTTGIAPRALRELAVYEKIVPELYPAKLRARTVPDLLPTLAHCFLTHETRKSGKALLFLENLKVSGFRSCDPDEDEFDFNHALLGVETLARFHAQSYFMLRQLGGKAKGRMALVNKFPLLSPSDDAKNVAKNGKLAQVYASFFEQIILPVVEAEHPSLAFKLRRKVQDPEALFRKMGEFLEKEKYENDDFYVICHGDYRVDHLLFKYDGSIVGEEPVECRMVDLKNIRLAPLASDLTFFMFTSLSPKMRDDFEEKLIAFYCDSFEAQLRLRYKQEGIQLKDEDFDIEDFHRKVEDQYKRMLEFGFYACVTALPLIYTGFSGILENLGEVYLENGTGNGGGGTTTSGNNSSVLDSLQKPDKFTQLAKECLNSDKLKESILGVVKRLVKARVFN